MHNPTIVAVLSLVFLATACTSTQKRAEENLQAGNFEAALPLYERLHKSKPSDPAIAAGLETARDGVVSKRLISVRTTRMAGNQEQALNLLLETVQAEIQWGYGPKAKVAFTQSEEAGFALPYFEQRVKLALSEKHPLQAEVFHQRYQSVFQGGETVTRYAAAGARIKSAGKERCKEFGAKVTGAQPYYSEFVYRFCAHSGAEAPRDPARIAKSRSADLYKSVELSGEVAGLPSELVPSLQEAIRLGFEASPWFDGEGQKVAAVKITGKYTLDHQKDFVKEVQNYTVSEPYQELAKVTKIRKVDYTVTEMVRDPRTGASIQQPITRQRDEAYETQEIVTRNRDVAKVYQYNALRHRQKIELQVSGEGELGPRRTSFDLHEMASREGMEHDLDVPEAKLKPSRPNLIEPHGWTRENFGHVRSQISERASTLWASLYCSAGDAGTDLASTGNQVHRCLRAKPAGVPPYVNEWYVQNLGVPYAEADRLLSTR